MGGIDEATKRMLLAKLEEEVPASQSERRAMLLSNLKVIQSYANDSSSTVNLHQLDVALTSTVRILAKASTVKPRVQSNDGAAGESCLCVSCFIGEDTIDELLSEDGDGGGMVGALLTTLKRPCPKPNVYHMTCGMFTTLCRTHQSADVAHQIMADGGLDRVLELMEELLDDDFMQLTFLRFNCTLSQVVDTKEDTSRCLDLLPTVMDRHATSPIIYYRTMLVSPLLLSLDQDVGRRISPGPSAHLSRMASSSTKRRIKRRTISAKICWRQSLEKRMPRCWLVRERSSSCCG